MQTKWFPPLKCCGDIGAIVLGLDMWRQADRNTLQVADISTCGWNVLDGILSIDWDSDETRPLSMIEYFC